MTGRPILARAAAVAVTLAAFTLAACAPIPSETKPHAIDRDKVADLFPEATTTLASGSAVGNVCFVPPQKDNTPVSDWSCDYRVDLPELSVASLIDALAAGPVEYRDEGVTSLVPPDTRLLGLERSATLKIVDIDLSEEIKDVSNPNNVRAYQQIVWTLTDPANRLDIDAVRVRIDGESTKVPTDDGPKDLAYRHNFHDSEPTPPTTKPKPSKSTR